jgi:hypothetical protein
MNAVRSCGGGDRERGSFKKTQGLTSLESAGVITRGMRIPHQRHRLWNKKQ